MVRLERPLPPEGAPPRLAELWAWTAIDPMTDVEGILAYRTRGDGAAAAVTGSRELAERMRPLIEAVVRSAAEPRPVARLRRFVAVEE